MASPARPIEKKMRPQTRTHAVSTGTAPVTSCSKGEPRSTSRACIVQAAPQASGITIAATLGVMVRMAKPTGPTPIALSEGSRGPSACFDECAPTPRMSTSPKLRNGLDWSCPGISSPAPISSPKSLNEALLRRSPTPMCCGTDRRRTAQLRRPFTTQRDEA
eukprot:scaffold2191_cov138-Isochrysis_galbana.AAC.5